MSEGVPGSAASDTVDAAEAVRLGMITEAVPDERLDDAVAAWAARLAEGPTRTIGYLKNGINFGLTNDMERSLEF